MADVSGIVVKSWPEATGIMLLLIGFVIALTIESAWLNIVIIILAGLMAGRLVYEKKGKQPLFPFFLIILLLLVGYLLGSLKVSRLLLLIIFAASMYASYKLHKNKYIP